MRESYISREAITGADQQPCVEEYSSNFLEMDGKREWPARYGLIDGVIGVLADVVPGLFLRRQRQTAGAHSTQWVVRAWALCLTALVVAACGGAPLSTGGLPSTGSGSGDADRSPDGGLVAPTMGDAAATSPGRDGGTPTRRPYRAIGVVTGEVHACALLEDHQVKCWGDNDTGQLGYGDTVERGLTAAQMGDALPKVDLGTGRTAAALTANEYGTCALLDDGSVKCWGEAGTVPNIGDAPGEMGDALAPLDFGGRRATHVALGRGTGCATMSDDTLWCWSFGSAPHMFGTGPIPKVKSLSSSAGLQVWALFEDGSIRQFPNDDPGTFELADVDRGHAIVSISGDFGTGDWVVYDDGTIASSRTFTPFATGAVAVGAQFSGEPCVVTSTGAVRCERGCGQNTPYWCDLSAEDPKTVTLGQPARAVTSGGANFTCALLTDGGIKCWSLDGVGSWLGASPTVTKNADGMVFGTWSEIDLGTVPVAAASDEASADLDAGTADDVVAPTDATSLKPPPILGDAAASADGAASPPLDGSPYRVLQVVAGEQHACALLDDHNVKCWGDNLHGQLGYGDTATRGASPFEMGDALPIVDLGTGRTAAALAANHFSTCAILDDGSLKCWGLRDTNGLASWADVGDQPGQMGDALAPLDFGGGRVTHVAIGRFNACASTSDDTIWCWDYSAPRMIASAPAPIAALSAAGSGQVWARFEDGSIGELPTNDVAYATALMHGHKVVDVTGDVGAADCLALDDGTVSCGQWSIGAESNSPFNTGTATAVGTGYASGNPWVLTATGAVQAFGGCDGLTYWCSPSGAMDIVEVTLGQRARAITNGGGGYECALLDDGGVKCWAPDGAAHSWLGAGAAISADAAGQPIYGAWTEIDLGHH